MITGVHRQKVIQRAVHVEPVTDIIALSICPAEHIFKSSFIRSSLGISRQHLASVEAPGMNRGLSLELLFNIATVLEIEPWQLLKFKLEK